MEVDSLRSWYVETGSEDQEVMFLLSDGWVTGYQIIKRKLIDTGLLQLDIDILEEIADQFLGFLTLDMGPVSIGIGLVAIAIYELLEKVVVKGFKIVRYPAKTGKGKTGKVKLGQGRYTIEPHPIK